MLFVDQALPSAGASGMAMVSGAFSRMGMPRAVVASIVLMDVAMYYLAYASCMAVALGVALHHGYLPGWVNTAMLLFVFAGLGVTWFVTALPGGGMGGLKTRLHRHAKLARLLDSVDQARPESFRQKRVMFQAFSIHTMTFLLDAATIWVAARALGVAASPGGVFVSFMVSSLFRTVGIMPGGLGTFEAASVMSLKSIGLPLPVGLSATLLFRGLSFWLPMIPGLICSRRLLGKQRNGVD
jgi:Mg2+-importing ATPase